MRELNHPNVVKFYGAWLRKKELYIAMELCQGGAGNDLYQIPSKPVPEPVIALLMRDMLRALEYTHAQCVMHRYVPVSSLFERARQRFVTRLNCTDRRVRARTAAIND